MSRPATVQDLPADDLVGERVFTLNTHSMPASGALVYAMGQFMIAAEKAGLVASSSYSDKTWSIPATDEEKLSRLEKLQDKWDRAQVEYETIQLTGTKPSSDEYSLLQRVRWYMTREQVAAPWDEAPKDVYATSMD